MTIFEFIEGFSFAMATAIGARRLQLHDASPNPARIAEQVLGPYESDLARHLRAVNDQNHYAPAQQEQSLDELKQAVVENDQEIERREELRRSLKAALHERIDREEAVIAARTTELAKLRASLGPRDGAQEQ